ncbi:hypothetical protein UYSO10_2536 [Kosakonia radicincitans]|nr:hypothetical protein UYSO10_2536 [Kosakonia radicincitans]
MEKKGFVLHNGEEWKHSADCCGIYLLPIPQASTSESWSVLHCRLQPAN